MRKVLATSLAALAAAATVAGCGSSSGSNGKDPLDEALGYLPKTAPLVVTIDTDPNGSQWKSLSAILHKFSFGDQIAQQLKQSISKQGLDFDKQVKPLLGNPAVIGAPTAQSILGSGNSYVIALKVKDKGKLSSLLKQSKDLKSDGSSNGATLYRQTDGSGETAQAGDVVLAADTKANVIQALEQRGKSDGLTEDQFNSALSDLPKDALVRVYADLQTLLGESPSTAQARKVKWIAALRTLGLTGQATNNAISFDFNLKTDPAGLTDPDVPIATGDASPGVIGKPGELVFGLRGVNQVIDFAQSVAQTISPGSFADFVRAKAQIGAQLGIDVDKDVIEQFSGNTSIAVSLNGGYAIRAELKDPAAFSKTLAKLARVAPSFASGIGLKGARLTKSGGLYKLSGRGSSKNVYFGVVNKVFVISTDPARIAQLAAATPRPVPGAKGAFVTSSDAGAILAQLISSFAGGGLSGQLGGSLASAPLGNLDGWAGASTSGLKGHLQLGIK
jgi:Protein of unknown function (DUF3352)